ncbi:MAG: hypothetical protein MUC77_05065 [Chromatiaceae bacterium]|nr:hypothetical protein [Chromatiaceae bacterium]
MIIRSLEAEDLLCYRRLRLADLPQRGLIGVGGDNETGKSAIGELLCLALFGRTDALGPDRIAALVRWGAPRGSLGLVVTVHGQDYEIRRQFDRDGEQSARLGLTGAAEPLARGTDAVAERLTALLGFGFEAYLETFYLAQRELRAPDPSSPTLRRMAAVAPSLACAEELRAEVAVEQEAAQHLADRVAAIDAELAALAASHPSADGVDEELAATQRRERAVAGLLQGLPEIAQAYAGAARPSLGEGLRRGLAGLASALVLLATFLVVGLWVLLRLRPDLWPLPALGRWLDGLAAPLGLTGEAVLVYGGIALGGVLLLLGLWHLARALAGRRRLNRGRRLAAWLEQLDDLDIGPVGPLRRPIAADQLEPGGVALGTGTLVDRPDSERRMRLAQRVLALAASPQEVRSAVAHERAWLEHLGGALVERRQALGATLERARLARERARALAAERAQASQALDGHRARIATATLASELLEGSARHGWERFAERLGARVGRLLPRLTDGGYTHLELDETLRVRLYCADKHGFLEAAETSSGTQRQVLLALRLALVGELAARLGRDRPFVFLDEPFAFSDETRIRGGLTALRDDEAVGQVWVVAQRFPQDAGLALEIRCGRHPDTLEGGGRPLGPHSIGAAVG